ncbi:AraC family transcriptional regulator [Marinomonas sp.]|nr:AraC family transcriptional regulator [Marinomonas sp.]MDB4837146.1 AraC family transcriptional regulator [Marinomonas sp.]
MNSTESSKIWKNEAMSGIELLSARYTKFEFSKHWHDELAIGIIEDGAEGLLYRGQNLIVPKKHIVAINPSEVHTGFAATEDGWRYRMFYFDLPALSAQFETSCFDADSIIDHPVIDNEALFDSLLNLHLALEHPSFALTKESLFALALDQLFTQYGSSKIQALNPVDLKSSYLARDYLMDHYDANPSLETLETLTHCSKFQLIKSFKSLFGVTPHQYLLLIKAQKAKQFLSQGMTCIDTSLACGFYDQSHFTRNFKRAFGVSPSNYLVTT